MLTNRPSLPYVSEVARSLVGVLLIATIALQMVSPGAALAAGGAAAIAGAVALQDGGDGRVSTVVGLSAVSGVAVLFGMLSAQIVPLFAVVAALSCFAAGMTWALGSNAGMVAAAVSALVITATPTGSVGDAGKAAALAVAGGLAEVLLVMIWPRRRLRIQRDAFTRAYRSVAADARKLVADPDMQFETAPLISLRDMAASPERQTWRAPPQTHAQHGLPERIAMTLHTLRNCDRNSPAVLAAVKSSADTLEALSAQGRSTQEVTAAALREVDTAVDGLQDPAATAGRRLSSQLHEACALAYGRYRERQPRPVDAARGALDVVRAQLDSNSPLYRHAVRLAGAVAVGTVLAGALDMPLGNWIALTALVALRPETAHTYTRCAARVGGTVVGVVVATTITMVWQPIGLDAAVVAVLFLAAAYATSGISPILLSASLAAAVVVVLDVAAPANLQTLSDRALATLLGGVLAVMAHLMIPDRAMVRLQQRSAELLKAEIDYAATVIAAFVHELENRPEVLRSAWHRAARARTAFEAACGAVRVDSRDVRKRLAPYRATLNAITGACAVLEDQLPAASPAGLDRRFVVAVDDYTVALRGDRPCAGRPWTIDAVHLTETDQQLRDAVALLGSGSAAQRILVAQTATVTRHLQRIAPDFT